MEQDDRAQKQNEENLDEEMERDTESDRSTDADVATPEFGRLDDGDRASDR